MYRPTQSCHATGSRKVSANLPTLSTRTLCWQVLPELEAMLAEAEKTAALDGRYHAAGGSHAGKQHEEPEPEPARVCVVCLDREATHAFIPCGHQCVCGADGEAIMQQPVKLCPVCRVPSECIVHIY